jgi:hypothetical protein
MAPTTADTNASRKFILLRALALLYALVALTNQGPLQRTAAAHQAAQTRRYIDGAGIKINRGRENSDGCHFNDINAVGPVPAAASTFEAHTRAGHKAGLSPCSMLP